MDIEKQITNLLKQNDGMETSFKNKGITFNKLTINDSVNQETMLGLLKDYNEYLKTISKNNKPPPTQKPKEDEQAKKLEEKTKKQEKQEKPKKSEEDEEEDDVIKEVKPTYSTITNMEDIKRAFFSKEYDSFYQLVRQHPFKYYSVNYKYSSDNTGRPSYVAKNLLRGFVQGLDDYRKYLMVCFRCKRCNDPTTTEYIYPSYWIINSNDDIQTMLGSLYDDYEFTLVEDDEINDFLHRMEKTEDDSDESLIGEVYLH